MRRTLLFITGILWIHLGLSQNERLLEASKLLNKDNEKVLEVINEQVEDPEISDIDKSLAFYLRAYIKKDSDIGASFWDYLESLRYLNASGEVNHRRRSGLYTNLGGIYHKYSDYSRAIEYYQKALEISTDNIKKNLYYNLALSQSKMGDDAVAIETLKDGFKYCGDDRNQIAKFNSKIGTINADAGQFDKAIDFQFKVINDSGRIKPKYLGKAYHNLGSAYTLKGDTIKAMASLEKAIVIKKTKKEKFLSLQDLSELLMETRQYKQAIEIGTIAESYYDQVDEIPKNFALFEIIAEAFYQSGDKESYRVYMEKFLDASDRFNNNRRNIIEEGNKNLIASLTEQHEEEVSHRSQSKISRTIIIICVVGIILLAIILAFWKIRFRLTKKDIENELKNNKMI